MIGEFSEELNNLIERFEKAPQSRLFAPLADAYRKSGDVERAIELCEKGLERYPEYASAHVILGKCFYAKGATERARAEFLRVLELDPENMVALKFMGDILLAEDDREKAVEYYGKLLAIDPTNEAVARMLDEMQEEFNVKKIDLGDDKAIKKVESPKELATMTLAGIYAAQGYYNKALKIYQDIIQKEPENSEALEMVEKLQSIMDSSDRERDDAFKGEVLTISLEDVDKDLAESTVGEGGSQAGEFIREDAFFAGEEGIIDGLAGMETPGEVEGRGEIGPDGESSKRADEVARAARELEREDEEAHGEGKERPDDSAESAEPPGEPDAEKEEGDGAGMPAVDMDNFRKWLRKMKDDKDQGN